MNIICKKGIVCSLIILSTLVIDQIIKILVKTGMSLAEKIYITDWFQLYFVENNGMAFGWEVGGKYFLTGFRIIAVIAIAYFMTKEIKRNSPMGYLVCLSLILAGAAGNIIDCLFYGLVFEPSYYNHVSQFVPWGEGYGVFMKGKVVDMFYFPLVEWDMPGWSWLDTLHGYVTLIPGSYQHCVFFSPIFNFADAAISCGIIALLLFYNKRLSAIVEEPKDGLKETDHQQQDNDE